MKLRIVCYEEECIKNVYEIELKDKKPSQFLRRVGISHAIDHCLNFKGKVVITIGE